jgi:hypothetical protein
MEPAEKRRGSHDKRERWIWDCEKERACEADARTKASRTRRRETEGKSSNTFLPGSRGFREAAPAASAVAPLARRLCSCSHTLSTRSTLPPPPHVSSSLPPAASPTVVVAFLLHSIFPHHGPLEPLPPEPLALFALSSALRTLVASFATQIVQGHSEFYPCRA